MKIIKVKSCKTCPYLKWVGDYFYSGDYYYCYKHSLDRLVGKEADILKSEEPPLWCPLEEVENA